LLYERSIFSNINSCILRYL